MATDNDLLQRAFESVGGLHVKLDTLITDQRRTAAKVDKVDKALDQHIADDDRRFGKVTRDAKRPPPLPPVPARQSFADEAEITGQHLAIVETARTERWKIVAGVVLAGLTLAGAVQAGRASAQIAVPNTQPARLP